LVKEGILERSRYQERPPRYEYRLTEKGRDLWQVLAAMLAWGDRWMAGRGGPPVLLRHHGCGKVTHADVRCAECGVPLTAPDVIAEPGPGSSITAAR
jgi:hypothetical protein